MAHAGADDASVAAVVALLIGVFGIAQLLCLGAAELRGREAVAASSFCFGHHGRDASQDVFGSAHDKDVEGVFGGGQEEGAVAHGG